MAKHSILSDTFEQLVELGKSAVKSTTQTMKGAQKASQKSDKTASSEGEVLKRLNAATKEGQAENSQHTALDMAHLEEQYKNQDKEKVEEVRRKLEFFKRFKEEEKKAQEQRKREIQEKLQREAAEEEEKKKKQEKALKPIEAPKGKERKSIFAPKKVAKRSQVETRAGSGKQ